MASRQPLTHCVMLPSCGAADRRFSLTAIRLVSPYSVHKMGYKACSPILAGNCRKIIHHPLAGFHYDLCFHSKFKNKTLDSFYKEARQAAEGPLLSRTPTCREVRTPAASLSPLLLLEFCRGWTRLGTQDCSQANEGGFPPTTGPPLH